MHHTCVPPNRDRACYGESSVDRSPRRTIIAFSDEEHRMGSDGLCLSVYIYARGIILRIVRVDPSHEFRGPLGVWPLVGRKDIIRI